MNRIPSKVIVGIVAVIGVGIVAGWLMKGELSARYAAYRLGSASDDAARLDRARELVALAPGSNATITNQMASGTVEIRKALLDAIAELPADDPRFGPAAFASLDCLDQLDNDSLDSALLLIPKLVLEPGRADRARAIMESAFKGSRAMKVAACRTAIQDGVEMAAAVVPLLADEDAFVRRAAVLAVGPTGPGTQVVSEEDLFKLLGDPDGDVRTLTAAALGTRGLNDRQIAFGRKLMHRDATVRMSLLIDLKFADDSIKDVGPWLARLAKDTDPAVRAGAARVAYECRISSRDWLADMAEHDPDGLVRQVAGHYRQKADDVRPVGFER
ncbi:MAG: hypothetical protein U0798_05525 [Gemmataceae bacterium]